MRDYSTLRIHPIKPVKGLAGTSLDIPMEADLALATAGLLASGDFTVTVVRKTTTTETVRF